MAKRLRFRSKEAQQFREKVKKAAKTRSKDAIAKRFHDRSPFPFMKMAKVIDKRVAADRAKRTSTTLNRLQRAQVVQHRMRQQRDK